MNLLQMLGTVSSGIPPTIPNGQALFTTSGSWICPVGGGSGSGGSPGSGAQGAVRIIWGTGRAFPSTLTGNL